MHLLPPQVLATLPSGTHPMTQLCTAVLALQVGGSCCFLAPLYALLTHNLRTAAGCRAVQQVHAHFS